MHNVHTINWEKMKNFLRLFKKFFGKFHKGSIKEGEDEDDLIDVNFKLLKQSFREGLL